MTHFFRLAVVAGVLSCLPAARTEAQLQTLAYDGFNTGTGAGSYRNHMRPKDTAPVRGTIGFSDQSYWGPSTSHFYPRPKSTRELTHNLLEGTQPGCMGQWTFNGVRCIRRNLIAAPRAKSGVYTLALLICVQDNPLSQKVPGSRTTGQEGQHGMIGFTPGAAGDKHVGTDGAKGLSLGYHENGLRVFAGGKSFVILDGYKMGVTYLLVAEMTANASGPDYIKGFYAAHGDKALTPAKFNNENGDKGAEVETWASPEDMLQMEIFGGDPMGGGAMGFPQASMRDNGKLDFVTWDEVRLMNGKAAVPIPNDQGDPAALVTVAPKPPRNTLNAKLELPPKLAGYFPFDEGNGDTAKDTAGGVNGKLLRATWVQDGVRGGAMHFTAKAGPKYGPHMAALFSVPHEAAVAADFPWERWHKFTFSAWVRGGDDFKDSADIITKAHGARVEERIFADIKGLAFMIAGGKLELELVNSINFPQPDMRIKVRSSLGVPGDNQWHHVAVSYDGSSKPSGVAFYVDGTKDAGFSFDFSTLPGQPRQLTDDIGTTQPYCIGGRALKDLQDGPSMRGSGYNMVGDIDEVGIFTYVLAPGQILAVRNLAVEPELKYTLGQANRLIELQRAGSGTVTLGNRAWEPVKNGLGGEVGKVQKGAAGFFIRFGDDGSGVRSK